jgi:hypothetical protein
MWVSLYYIHVPISPETKTGEDRLVKTPPSVWVDGRGMRMTRECPVCHNLFSSSTRRVYCSKMCSLVNNRSYINRVKARLAPSLRPTTSDIAWAAGVYEAEGHCRRMGADICVSQKDPWILFRLRDLFGGSVGKPGAKDQRYWYLAGPRALGFVFTIFQFLSPWRREQIKGSFAN